MLRLIRCLLAVSIVSLLLLLMNRLRVVPLTICWSRIGLLLLLVVPSISMQLLVLIVVLSSLGVVLLVVLVPVMCHVSGSQIIVPLTFGWCFESFF